jgi:Uma2 family endonuclease
VEVVSPNDTSEEVDEKVIEWLKAGVRLVWVVSPALKTVRIHRPRTAGNGSVSLLLAEDTITGEDVIPGFSAKVAEFFDAD